MLRPNAAVICSLVVGSVDGSTWSMFSRSLDQSTSGSSTSIEPVRLLYSISSSPGSSPSYTALTLFPGTGTVIDLSSSISFRVSFSACSGVFAWPAAFTPPIFRFPV